MTGPSPLPLTQYVDRPGVIDLGWGHPDPALLDVEGIGEAAAAALRRYGPDALTYGHGAGPGPLIEWVGERLRAVDADGPAGAETLITAGNSWAIDQVATLLAEPGDVVLVESPTYHLAVRILRDHPLRLVPVPFDGDGIVVDAATEALAAERAAGRRVRFLYTVPTFHNPTGLSLSVGRRRDLVELAAREGFFVLEDDAYRELAYDGPPPASLWSGAPRGTVVRIGSFAKSLAPGLRVGFLTADARTVSRFADGGVLDSGGGISHFAALVVAEYGASGAYAANLERLRAAYRERRDALLDELVRAMPAGTAWTRPRGGYFAWVTLPAGRDAGGLLGAAEGAGTSYVPAGPFLAGAPDGRRGAGGAGADAADDDRVRRSLRLAFSRFPPDVLREAIRRLGRAAG